MTSLFASAFPDFDVSTLPTIPADWVDISYRNDSCPSWQAGPYVVFIDYADEELRENEGARFIVMQDDRAVHEGEDWLGTLAAIALSLDETESSGDRIAAENEFFAEAERVFPALFGEASAFSDWALKATSDERIAEALRLIHDARAPLLGDAYAATVRGWLSDEELTEAKRRNATPEYVGRTCATADFCDTNEAMSDAFLNVLGHGPDVFDRADGSEGPDVPLWNAAWAYAKATHFTA
jgi:hypothetical protein